MLSFGPTLPSTPQPYILLFKKRLPRKLGSKHSQEPSPSAKIQHQSIDIQHGGDYIMPMADTLGMPYQLRGSEEACEAKMHKEHRVG